MRFANLDYSIVSGIHFHIIESQATKKWRSHTANSAQSILILPNRKTNNCRKDMNYCFRSLGISYFRFITYLNICKTITAFDLNLRLIRAQSTCYCCCRIIIVTTYIIWRGIEQILYSVRIIADYTLLPSGNLSN